jgi:hypothetical protein
MRRRQQPLQQQTQQQQEQAQAQALEGGHGAHFFAGRTPLLRPPTAAGDGIDFAGERERAAFRRRCAAEVSGACAAAARGHCALQAARACAPHPLLAWLGLRRRPAAAEEAEACEAREAAACAARAAGDCAAHAADFCDLAARPPPPLRP